MIKLRDLIRSVRACKTAAEERAVISKECALIRTAIKEEDEQYRHRNVAKLMYIHMLGYPTHFGQMECLKLISAPTFPGMPNLYTFHTKMIVHSIHYILEKRIGYLALTLLLTEQTEVLTLVTNSLKLDLTNPNPFIQALSLIAIGNLSTQDMARDLASDVERILKGNNPYLKKKAALATIRLLKKEPDLIEHMAECVHPLLKEKSHGILITAVQLIIDILDIHPDLTTQYAEYGNTLARILKGLSTSTFSPEFDVSGIMNPFLQVKILTLLRKLGKGNAAVSEQMNDVLMSVATNTETTKNAGNAILYECVQTIMEVESDANTRVLAVNILGRFLLNRDNNIRYVALNSLSKVVFEDIAAVQRHRSTIVDCLKDADVSIRQRALELIYQLVNESNVVNLTSELLNYLVVAPSDHKPSLVSKIMNIVESFSPNRKWRVDTIITMLSIAGNGLDDAIPRASIIFIAQADGLQGYVTHRVYQFLLEDTSQLGLLQVGLWCIGEYGDQLGRNCPAPDSESSSYMAIPESDMLAILEKCMYLHNSDLSLKALILNTAMKLSTRLGSHNMSAINDFISRFKNSMNLELQQRSTEYSLLLASKFTNLRSELLSKMPVLDESAVKRKKQSFAGNDSGAANSSGNLGAISAPSGNSGSSSLLDLDDIFGLGSNSVAPATTHVKPVTNTTDLLSDIFAVNTTISPNPVPVMGNMGYGGMPPVAPTFNNMTPMMGMNQGMMNNMLHSTPVMNQQAAVVNPAAIKAFDKNGLQILIDMSKPVSSQPSKTKLLCKFVNLTSSPMDSLMFQAAVPKYLKLEMAPPSSLIIPANSNGSVTQEIQLDNSMQGEKPIMLKLKIGYNQNGNKVEELAQVSSFPANY